MLLVFSSVFTQIFTSSPNLVPHFVSVVGWNLDSTDKMGYKLWTGREDLRKNGRKHMQNIVDKMGYDVLRGRQMAAMAPSPGAIDCHWWHLPSPQDVVPHFVNCFLPSFPTYSVNLRFQPKACTPFCQWSLNSNQRKWRPEEAEGRSQIRLTKWGYNLRFLSPGGVAKMGRNGRENRVDKMGVQPQK